ncbi:MAG: hypothetical protein QXK37_04635 [Candidatus Woesearchaeota archaeon]
MAELKRQVAYKVSIGRLTCGQYKRQDDSEPSYVLVDNIKMYRVNVLGAIVTQDEDRAILEDSTGQIELRFFDRRFPLSIGEVVLVIGRPREFNNRIFIVPEIMKRLTAEWLKLRQIELCKKPAPPTSETIISIIKELDNGDGVDIEAVLKKANFSGCETIIQNLLKGGDIFQVKHGRLKALD